MFKNTFMLASRKLNYKEIMLNRLLFTVNKIAKYYAWLCHVLNEDSIDLKRNELKRMDIVAFIQKKSLHRQK